MKNNVMWSIVEELDLCVVLSLGRVSYHLQLKYKKENSSIKAVTIKNIYIPKKL